LRGFIVSNHADMQEAFLADMTKWVKEGKMKWRETILEGIERAPEAFIGLFKGDNFGKMLVKVGDSTM
jgi:NADPH-dependent curcumin reductase CurA